MNLLTPDGQPTKPQVGDVIAYERRTGCFTIARNGHELRWNLGSDPAVKQADNKCLIAGGGLEQVPVFQIIICLAATHGLNVRKQSETDDFTKYLFSE